MEALDVHARETWDNHMLFQDYFRVFSIVTEFPIYIHMQFSA